MEKTTEEVQLRKIISYIKEARLNGISATEILMGIDDIRPTKIIIQEKEPKTSPEQLEYARLYRERIRKQKKENKLKQKKELVKQKKISHALLRQGFKCYSCNLQVKCDSKTNTHIIETKKNSKRPKIIILNQCPSCGSKLKAFGGYL